MQANLRHTDLDTIARLSRSGRRSLWSAVRRAARALRDNAPMDVVAWIESHIFLSSSMSDRPGEFRLTAPQKAIIRDLCRRGTKRGPLPKVPRFGMTTVLCAVMLHFACHEGLDVLYTERNDDACQTFYKGVLAPMLEGSEKIAHLKRVGRDGNRFTAAIAINLTTNTLSLYGPYKPGNLGSVSFGYPILFDGLDFYHHRLLSTATGASKLSLATFNPQGAVGSELTSLAANDLPLTIATSAASGIAALANGTILFHNVWIGAANVLNVQYSYGDGDGYYYIDTFALA